MANVELKPARVFEQFAKINAIPRPSKHEEKMIEYLKAFGQERGLETKVDETGNVIIRKPATPGMENKPCVILQSHMDMVCDKLVDVEIDFRNDPIQTYVDGEWLKAKGTTLGADDGIGCAIELALLDSDDIEHGPVECVFTVDEETGLTGAFGMKPGFMSGKYLINLDSEDEGQIFVSCAGGINTSAKYEFTREDAPEGYFFFEGSLKGPRRWPLRRRYQQEARQRHQDPRPLPLYGAGQDGSAPGPVELGQDAQRHPPRRQDRLLRARRQEGRR